jgi:hypothetical protein
LARNSQEANEHDLGGRYGEVPGDDRDSKDGNKAKASRHAITDVTRGLGLRYA